MTSGYVLLIFSINISGSFLLMIYFKGIIDYIYHTSHLKTLGVLGGIDENWLKSVPGFPNPVIPSDHLSLLTEFELTQERKTSL